MGWLERVKRNVWVDLYAEFDEKGNDIRYVRILPEDLDRLIAIAEGVEWGQIYDSADRGYYRGCNLCGVFDMGAHLEHCPYHENWKP